MLAGQRGLTHADIGYASDWEVIWQAHGPA